MKAVIMAGGRGTRLMPLTADKPKPMVEVAGKPILEWHMEWLIAQGFDSFVVTANHLKDKIIDYFGNGSKWGVSIDYPDEKIALGSAGALRLSLPFLGGEKGFFVTNGDLLTNVQITSLSQPKYAANVALFPFKSPYGIVHTSGDKIEKFEEKPFLKDYWINGGIYYFTTDSFSYLPEKGDLAFNVLTPMARDGRLGCMKYSPEYCKMIDSIKDLEEANADAEKGLFKDTKPVS